jgi:hypothetical protein
MAGLHLADRLVIEPALIDLETEERLATAGEIELLEIECVEHDGCRNILDPWDL